MDSDLKWCGVRPCLQLAINKLLQSHDHTSWKLDSSERKVWQTFWREKIRKTPSLNGVSSSCLKACAEQLGFHRDLLQVGDSLQGVKEDTAASQTSESGRTRQFPFGNGILDQVYTLVLLVLSIKDLQHAPGQFASQCEMGRMRISTSKS